MKANDGLKGLRDKARAGNFSARRGEFSLSDTMLTAEKRARKELVPFDLPKRKVCSECGQVSRDDPCELCYSEYRSRNSCIRCGEQIFSAGPYCLECTDLVRENGGIE